MSSAIFRAASMRFRSTSSCFSATAARSASSAPASLAFLASMPDDRKRSCNFSRSLRVFCRSAGALCNHEPTEGRNHQMRSDAASSASDAAAGRSTTSWLGASEGVAATWTSTYCCFAGARCSHEPTDGSIDHLPSNAAGSGSAIGTKSSTASWLVASGTCAATWTSTACCFAGARCNHEPTDGNIDHLRPNAAGSISAASARRSTTGWPRGSNDSAESGVSASGLFAGTGCNHEPTDGSINHSRSTAMSTDFADSSGGSTTGRLGGIADSAARGISWQLARKRCSHEPTDGNIGQAQSARVGSTVSTIGWLSGSATSSGATSRRAGTRCSHVPTDGNMGHPGRAADSTALIGRSTST
mmetsp:Transcript_130537/g.377617  ORF Transcript_130537/g.377617 Transcript_130537/m.377617 type:complete len:358 (+) Transcript_130537:767-1840(+)